MSAQADSGWRGLLGRRYWVINAVCFEVGWFVCVLTGNIGALPYVAAAVALHFRFAPVHPRDGAALLVAVLLGLAHDNLLVQSGVLELSAGGGPAPLWLSGLWVLTALIVHHAMRWFYERFWVAVVTGAVAGPLAYVSGVALTDAQWGWPPVQAVALLALVWLCVFPLHRWLTGRLYDWWSLRHLG